MSNHFNQNVRIALSMRTQLADLIKEINTLSINFSHQNDILYAFGYRFLAKKYINPNTSVQNNTKKKLSSIFSFKCHALSLVFHQPITINHFSWGISKVKNCPQNEISFLVILLHYKIMISLNSQGLFKF